MTRILLLFLLGLTLTLPVRAMMAYVSDNELISSADVIIIGTVQSDTPVIAATNTGTGSAKALLRADKILRGPVPNPIAVIHPTPPVPGGGMVIMDHGGFALATGNQRLFFLQHTPEGYTIVGGTQGMRQPDEAEKFAPLIEQFPYSLALVAPVGPFHFDQPATVTVKVTNRSNASITCYTPRLEAYFYATKLGAIYFNQSPQATGTTDKGTEVPAGKEVTFKVQLVGQITPAWKILPADSYLQSPALVRARVFIQLAKVEGEDPNKAAMKNFNAATPWATALIGFPPPAGEASAVP